MNASFTFNPADGKFYNGTTALSNYAPELTYGEKPTWTITLKGVSTSGISSWCVAIDKDYIMQTEVMARTQSGITATASGQDVVLVVPIDTMTERFCGVVNGKKDIPAICGIYGLDNTGTQVFYCQFGIRCKYTVDPGMSGAVEPVVVSSLTLPQMDARYQKKGEGAEAKWGDITGDLEDQTDLKEELDGKATASDISTAVTTHDASATAHNDIRTEVAEKATATDISTAVSTHDASATAHNDIRTEMASKMPKAGGTFTGAVGYALTVIPYSTSAMTLSEFDYIHSPTNQPTYTMPSVSDASATHSFSLTIRFSEFMTSAPVFLTPDGASIITPKGIYSISTTSVVEYICSYDYSVGWVIYVLEVA